MPLLYLILSGISLGSLASARTRRRFRPGARTSRQLEAVKDIQRPPKTSINGGYRTATDVPMSSITRCPC